MMGSVVDLSSRESMERLPLKHGLMNLVCAQKLDLCKVSGFRLDEFLNVIVYAAG